MVIKRNEIRGKLKGVYRKQERTGKDKRGW